MAEKKSKLQRYAGFKTKIKINSWLSLFEVAAKVHKADTDTLKVALLMEFIDDEALQWYADHVADKIDTITWAEARTLMVQRFGERTIDPVLAANRRRLNHGESVQAYFEEKMYLLRQTGLSETSMAEVLTDGLPPYYRTPLIAASIKDTSEWLSKAVRLEASFGTRKPFAESNQDKKPAATAAFASGNKEKPKKKPPSACRICQEIGKTEFHWHSECPNRKPKKPESHSVTGEANTALSKNE